MPTQQFMMTTAIIAVEVEVSQGSGPAPNQDRILLIRPSCRNRFCPRRPVTAIGIM